jgi:hypothetical protein
MKAFSKLNFFIVRLDECRFENDGFHSYERLTENIQKPLIENWRLQFLIYIFFLFLFLLIISFFLRYFHFVLFYMFSFPIPWIYILVVSISVLYFIPCFSLHFFFSSSSFTCFFFPSFFFFYLVLSIFRKNNISFFNYKKCPIDFQIYVWHKFDLLSTPQSRLQNLRVT